MYSLILGTKTMVVLSSGEAIKELLDKRGIHYSGRPDSYVGMDLWSGGLRFLLMPYGPTFRLVCYLHLRTGQNLANMLNRCVSWLTDVSTLSSPRPTSPIKCSNKQMLHDLLHTPDDFLNHIRRYANSLTMSMVYGCGAHHRSLRANSYFS